MTVGKSGVSAGNNKILLEIKKIELEIAQLQRPWWKEFPSSMPMAMATVIVALIGYIGVYRTGYFSVERIRLENSLSELTKHKSDVEKSIALMPVNFYKNNAKIYADAVKIFDTKDGYCSDGAYKLLQTISIVGDSGAFITSTLQNDLNLLQASARVLPSLGKISKEFGQIFSGIRRGDTGRLKSAAERLGLHTVGYKDSFGNLSSNYELYGNFTYTFQGYDQYCSDYYHLDDKTIMANTSIHDTTRRYVAQIFALLNIADRVLIKEILDAVDPGSSRIDGFPVAAPESADAPPDL